MPVNDPKYRVNFRRERINSARMVQLNLQLRESVNAESSWSKNSGIEQVSGGCASSKERMTAGFPPHTVGRWPSAMGHQRALRETTGRS